MLTVPLALAGALLSLWYITSKQERTELAWDVEVPAAVDAEAA